MKLFLLFLVLAGFTFSQSHGLWVTRFTLKSKTSINNLLTFVENNKITDVFIQIRGRGDAFFKSKVEQNDINSHYESNLLFLISEMKKRHIKIHAWLNTFLMASSRKQLKIEKNHILNLNNHWVDSMSSLLQMSKSDSFEGLYTSPACTGLLNFYISLIEEILSRFQFDGIHLDYFRKASEKAGYHPKMRHIFHDETGMFAENLISHERQLFTESLSEEWTNFISDSYTKFLTKLVKNNPNAIWSVAVKPDYLLAKNIYGQDWIHWLKQGIVDFVIPMNYSPVDDLFYDQVTSYPSHFKKRIWLGIATYNQNITQFKNRYSFAKKNVYNTAIFSFDDLETKSILILSE
jgi:uncharacterized lipoprotein YddW (UPF0748 family)